MLSRIEGFLGLKRMGLAGRLTFWYAAVFALVLLVTSYLIMYGLNYSLYKQAADALSLSISGLHEILENPDEAKLEDFRKGTINSLKRRNKEIPEGELMHDSMGRPYFIYMTFNNMATAPGVIMRVVKESDGKVIYDNAPKYPATEDITAKFISRRTFFGEHIYDVSALDENSRIYVHEEVVEWGGVKYKIWLMRIITVDFQFMEQLRWQLLLANAFLILLALGFCYLQARKALRPLSRIADELQDIEVKQLGKRVTMPETEDEVHSLAVSLNKMLDRLKDGLEREQRFVSDASHELRTPLSIIVGHAGMLRRWGSEDPEMLKEGIETISDEADRMSKLVQRLLDLARADQKRLKLAPELFDMGELVGRVFRELQPVVTEHDFLLKGNEDGYVQADVATIRELLLILLDNARKYTPEGGTITLFGAQEGEEYHFGVRDTGVGISEKDQAHIFDRFFRVDDARTRQTGGAGLGLALAEQLALANGGRIEVESKLGKGTCMHVYLPLLVLE